MLKVNDFVFALLTLIFISSVAGEERTIFPKAKEWPQYSGFEWGISEDDFFKVCEKKKLQRFKFLGIWGAKGKLLGQSVEILPDFERKEGEYPNSKGIGLNGFTMLFRVNKESHERFFENLHNILKDKYGPSIRAFRPSRYLWGAPNMPHISCLQLDEPELGSQSDFMKIRLVYWSESMVKSVNKFRREIDAKKRESEKKAKEDEKDF